MAPFASTDQAKDIQGDILLDGLPKIAELFYFFTIENRDLLRQKLPTFTNKWVASVAKQQAERTGIKQKRKAQQQPTDQQHPKNGDTSSHRRTSIVDSALVNIAFSVSGVNKLQNAGEHMDDALDGLCWGGMRADALSLNDPAKKADHTKRMEEKDYVPDWHPEFLNPSNKTDVFIDGVILVAGGDEKYLHKKLDEITLPESEGSLFGAIKKHKLLTGKQRTKEGEEKHEHFGFLDGVSEPWVEGVDDTVTKPYEPWKDPSLTGFDRQKVKLDEIVCQDETKWTHNGSYMAFRYLVQKVPEFKRFCNKTAQDLKIGPMTFPEGDVRVFKGQKQVDGGDVLAARIIGRWPNGIPITHTTDTLKASTTPPTPHSTFDFKLGGESACPYAAHIRKTAPRMGPQTEGHHMMRRGIQFGDEVRGGETETGKSDFLDGEVFLDYKKEHLFRGLLFVCYQSDLDKGFKTVQRVWSNSEKFPPVAEDSTPGIDPLIGQVDPLPPRAETGEVIKIAGMADPKDGRNRLEKMPYVNELVLPAGGEYFFMPSITALTKNLPQGKAKVKP